MHPRQTTWSRKMARARRVCSAGPPTRLPSRTAFGTVRSSASNTATDGQDRRRNDRPTGVVAPHGLKTQGAQQDNHDQCDQVTHRPRGRRRAVVVRRDRCKHRIGQLDPLAVAENLNVEDEVHPQHGEQEPAACRQQQCRGVHRTVIPTVLRPERETPMRRRGRTTARRPRACAPTPSRGAPVRHRRTGRGIAGRR